ncbi:GGDEF domain-containing protein [Nocardioides sp.]|uniref:GGDEF domain-containing protein n=1 Tax=Nocardioides sp. TaxID=35761 RepID=UPI002CC39FE0|nr:GGDEF domain-containing protein [Nocardioides sp.]HXH81199.1 GGDEF domain-containing protein [Nocardioides sp.]
MRAWTHAGAALLLSILYVGALRLPGLSAFAIDFISNVGQILAAGFAALTCAVAARRNVDRHRAVWGWLAAGMGSWCLGQCVWTWYELLGRSVPFPSLADVGFLGFPLAAGFGLLLWLGTQGNQLVARSRDVIAGGIIALSLLVLSWVTALGAVVEAGAGDGVFALVLSLAYPIGDLIMATLVLIALTRGRTGERTSLLILALGLTVFAVADSAFVYLTSTSSFSSTDLVSNGGWVAGFLLMGVAGVWARHDVDSAHGTIEAALPRPSGMRIGLTYLPLLVAGAVVVADLLRNGAPRVELLLGVALVGMVLTHQFLAMTENQRLLTALAEAQDQLRHRALHDSLTGLANRVLFADRLDRALIHPDADVSVLFCDLDNFKQVNDQLGHDAGDAVLKLVAARLLECVRTSDTVARLGGDEFAIVLEGSGDPDAVAQRVVASMQAETVIGGQPIDTSISVGVARHEPVPAASGHDRRAGSSAPLNTPAERDAAAAQLLRQADTAMYAAKGAGKNRVSS